MLGVSWLTLRVPLCLLGPPSIVKMNKGCLLPFFLFVYDKEGDALGALTQKHGDH